MWGGRESLFGISSNARQSESSLEFVGWTFGGTVLQEQVGTFAMQKESGRPGKCLVILGWKIRPLVLKPWFVSFKRGDKNKSRNQESILPNLFGYWNASDTLWPNVKEVTRSSSIKFSKNTLLSFQPWIGFHGQYFFQPTGSTVYYASDSLYTRVTLKVFRLS